MRFCILNTYNPINNHANIKNKLNLNDEKIIVGVASVWTYSKGFYDFIRLNDLLSDEYKIILVGLNKKQIESLPENIIGIERTESDR